MGYLPVGDSGDSSSALGVLTIALPANLTAMGPCRVWIAFANNNTASSNTFTLPAGYTLLGSQTVFNSGVCGICYRDWVPGDPTSVTFAGTGIGGGNTELVSWLTKSNAATSVVSDQTDTTHLSSGSTNLSFKSFPPTNVGDLRMAVAFIGGVVSGIGVLTPPAVTASANNPTGIKFQQTIGLANGGFSIDVYYSLWEDPSGADANSEVWTMGSSAISLTRSLVLDDGSGSWTGADEVAPLYLVDSGITAHAIEDGGADGLSSSAGIFGGGARLV